MYRQLRTALERSGDVPGANDFYRGEIQARRRAARTDGPLGEKAVLSSYQWIAGWGLSALRPLMWLVALILLGSLLFEIDGFSPFMDDGGQRELAWWPETLVFTLTSTTGFVRTVGDVEALSEWEQVIQLALKVAGPALVAFSVIALRNRVKR